MNTLKMQKLLEAHNEVKHYVPEIASSKTIRHMTELFTAQQIAYICKKLGLNNISELPASLVKEAYHVAYRF